MNIVATLVEHPDYAHDILEKVPEESVVLLPEGCFPTREVVSHISKRRSLFVIFNEAPYYENRNRYNAMVGMEKGTPLWRVRKHFLWEDEKNQFNAPPEPEPIVNIGGKKSAVVICYEISKVARCGRLFRLGKIIAEEKVEMLLMPAYWQFNWGLPKQVTNICTKEIPSLEISAFSSSNVRNDKSYAMIFKRGNGYLKTKARNSWVSVEI